MKILIVLESEFPPDVRVENEALALTEAGHEVHVACATRKSRKESDKAGDIFIHRRSMSDFIYKSSVGCLKFPFYFSFWRRFIYSLCKIHKFDVIHISDLPLSKIGVEVKRKFKALLVIDLHENWPALVKTAPHTQTLAGKLLSSNAQWVKYEKKMLPQADKVITIIEEARERVQKLGVDRDKICMVSNTINYENLNIEPGKKEDKFLTLFYGGGLNRHRGLQTVLEALRICLVKNKNIRLWIVGEGSYRKELEKLTRENNIGFAVKFWGHKPFTEMLEILSQADAALIPHLRTDNNDASSPNKLYQYMYLNIPIISSDCTSLKRIIKETDTGFIYKSESVGDLSRLIENLSVNKELLNNLNGNGRKAVMEKYNWNVDKKRLVDAYNELEAYKK